jgi:hypothetical protein
MDSDNAEVEVVDLNDAVADADEVADGPVHRSGAAVGLRGVFCERRGQRF